MTANTDTSPRTSAPSAGPPPERADSHVGTGVLTRLAVRRDRVMLPAWVAGLCLMVVAGSSSLATVYGSAASRDDLARSMAGNSSLHALYGQLFDHTSIGGLAAWRFGTFGAALSGLMGILLVVRHTRDEEESGRLELVGAGAVGRRAPLTAALATAFGAGLALALLIAVGLVAQGEDGAGSLALGAAFGLVVAVFAGVAAVTAQLTETGRAARGLGCAVLGAAFLLRSAGDASPGSGARWLVWLSPLGWSEQVRPFAGERWWVLLLLAATSAALIAGAFALVGRRDLDAGLLASRPGPAGAGGALSGPFGLAWRLQRGALLGWAVGFAVAGLAFGAISDGAADLVKDNERLADSLRRLGGAQGLVDTFLATILALLAMVASVYAVQAVLRLRAEESSGRAEPVLAGAVGRLRWAASHVTAAVLGGTALLLLAGLAMGVGYGAATGDVGGQVPRLLGASLALLPGVWFVASVAVLLFGALPTAASASWGFVAAFLLIGLYGPMLDVAQPVLDLSPFSHLPKVPAQDVTALPLVLLTLGAMAATAVGLAAFRRRDLG